MSAPLTTYQKKLFLFLGVATFFEGYDFIALSQILPKLRVAFELEPAWSGYLVGTVNIGAVIAFFLVRMADRFGRRRMLTVTIAGYTAFTLLSGLAPNIYVFALLQLGSRIFLLAEWALSMVIAAEEFPADRRGLVIGFLQGINGVGSVVCALLVPFLVDDLHPERWRRVYFVAVVPLLLLAYARRGLKETQRFETQVRPERARAFMHIWSTPYRGRVLKLGAIWFVSYIAAQNATSLWNEHASSELGFTTKQVGLAIAIAAGISMPLVFGVGKLIDRIGRRRGAAVVYAVAAVGTYFCFTLEAFWPVTAALVLGIFGAQAYLPVLNAYTTELFPTELRGDAFAWCNSILGRVAYVSAPFAVGGIVGSTDLGYGPIVAATSVFPIVALALVFTLLPETTNLELEETAALADGA